MEAVRAAIEKQVIGLTGLALGGVDFENPPGDPGLFGPQSVIWQVHNDFTSMLCGGVSALLLQMLHPLALAGVWDHSNFRADMLGRLRRTSQFVSVTTFGPTAEAERLIAKVKAIHLRVNGVGSDGTPYAASDPDLLTWVHVAESSRFLASHLRHRNPQLSRDSQVRYYREAALIAAALVMQAGIDLLPPWAQRQFDFHPGALRRRLVRTGVAGVGKVLRGSMRNGSYQRAQRRISRAS